MAADDQRAGIRRLRAGDDLDQRALAAAVFAQQVINLARHDRERDALQGVHAAETFVDADDIQERSAVRRIL
ncbi:hypothetical protein D3C72_2446110 [compost metagenome]